MLATLLCRCATVCQAQTAGVPSVQVAKGKKAFTLSPSDKPFTPWGLNYDHDDKGRLLEDYWDDEWPTVEAHFGQMKALRQEGGRP